MKELLEIQSRLKAPKSQFNEFGKYKYRNCEDILEALKPLLKETEMTLIITDDLVLIGDRYYVKATVTLQKNGDSVSATAFARESAEKKGMDASQITGATSSYARKYALNGLLLIDDTKDADSEKPPVDTKPAAKPNLKQVLFGKMKDVGMDNEEAKKFFEYVGAKTDKELKTFVETFEAQYEAWRNEPKELPEDISL